PLDREGDDDAAPRLVDRDLLAVSAHEQHDVPWHRVREPTTEVALDVERDGDPRGERLLRPGELVRGAGPVGVVDHLAAEPYGAVPGDAGRAPRRRAERVRPWGRAKARQVLDGALEGREAACGGQCERAGERAAQEEHLGRDVAGQLVTGREPQSERGVARRGEHDEHGRAARRLVDLASRVLAPTKLLAHRSGHERGRDLGPHGGRQVRPPRGERVRGTRGHARRERPGPHRGGILGGCGRRADDGAPARPRARLTARERPTGETDERRRLERAPPVGHGQSPATRSITSGRSGGREPSGPITTAPSSASRARANLPGVSVCSVMSTSPARTRAPGFACSSTPAPAWTGSSRRARPAPRRHAATPTAYASSSSRTPSAGASTCSVSFATGSGASGSPSCARIMRRHTSIARPSASAASTSSPSLPALASISRASATVSSTTSGGPPPASTSTDSRTSSALPAVRPSGVDMSVMSAV